MLKSEFIRFWGSVDNKRLGQMPVKFTEKALSGDVLFFEFGGRPPSKRIRKLRFRISENHMLCIWSANPQPYGWGLENRYFPLSADLHYGRFSICCVSYARPPYGKIASTRVGAGILLDA